MSIFTCDRAEELFSEHVARALIFENKNKRELTSDEIIERYVQYKTEYLISPRRMSKWIYFLIIYCIPWVALFGGGLMAVILERIFGIPMYKRR